MTSRPHYHEGMRAFQDRFDGRCVFDRLEEHYRHDAFWPEERAMIEASPFLLIATARNAYVDCSIEFGDPDLIEVVGDDAVEYPEYDGNSMLRTVGDISRNPDVGLLFVRFDDASLRIRIDGRAGGLDDPASLSRHHGAQLVVRISCEIDFDGPRYAPNLVRGVPSPHPPWPATMPPAPEWKGWAALRDHLPRHDPHAGRDAGATPDGHRDTTYTGGR